jgi:hypothetical protein
MDLARLVAAGLLPLETAQAASAFPNEIQSQLMTLRSQAQAQATMVAGQGASTGSGTAVPAGQR